MARQRFHDSCVATCRQHPSFRNGVHSVCCDKAFRPPSSNFRFCFIGAEGGGAKSASLISGGPVRNCTLTPSRLLTIFFPFLYSFFFRCLFQDHFRFFNGPCTHLKHPTTQTVCPTPTSDVMIRLQQKPLRRKCHHVIAFSAAKAYGPCHLRPLIDITSSDGLAWTLLHLRGSTLTHAENEDPADLPALFRPTVFPAR